MKIIRYTLTHPALGKSINVTNAGGRWRFAVIWEDEDERDGIGYQLFENGDAAREHFEICDNDMGGPNELALIEITPEEVDQ